VTDPSPQHTQEPFRSGHDSPPPGGNRKTTIIVIVIIAALILAFIMLHLTGVMGAASH
jgi:hypothetical protein